jgi:hypothetical protein
MLKAFRSVMIVAALAAATPSIFENQVQACARCCCRTCRRPCGYCTCTTPAPQTSYQPVIETQYAQQPVIQQHDVAVTEYRAEPVLETVPVASYENVVVDEGSYQTVWVPRLTTKTVARTSFQTRAAYRTVPYQVTRRISEYATQSVPYSTVRYVPTGTALTYGTTPYLAGGIIPTYTAPTIVSAPIISAPIVAAAPASISSGLVPDARYADAPVTSIRPRSSSISSGILDGRTADRAPMFVPAPSAATVWRSRATATR